MTCRVCGRDNEEQAVKCRQCNALLRRPQEAKPAAAPAPKGKKALIVAGGAVALAVAAAALYLVGFAGTKEAATKVEVARPAPVTIEKQIANELQQMELEQERAIAELNLGDLYSPASFATREANMRSSFAMKEAEEREASYHRAWLTWRSGVLKRIQAASPEAQTKAALTKGIEAALNKTEQARARARTANKEWAYATLEVYDYAASNREHIDTSGSEVRIRHPEVEAGFRSRLARAQRLQQEASRLTQQAKQAHHALLQETGAGQTE